MRRFVGITFLFLFGCGSAPPASNLAGNWGGGLAVTTFVLNPPLIENFALLISVSGDTATIAGICGDYAPGGPSPLDGTANAPVMTLGTGTYAASSALNFSCPAVRVGRCHAVVFTYTAVSVLAGTDSDPNVVAAYGTDNVLSFAGSGTSDGCGVSDTLHTTFQGFFLEHLTSPL